MILQCSLQRDIEIISLKDFKKLKTLEENGLKVNWSRVSKEHGCDRRTAKKYSCGYKKPTTRKRSTQFDSYYETIKNLLDNRYKVFEYKRVLWQYLVDNHNLKAPASSFRRYISSIEEFQSYFTNKKKAMTKVPSHMRFETFPGAQAQIDWKESIDIVLKSGETITVNILVVILSYSRFRFYKLTLSKTQEVLLNHLDEAFELFGGVPKEILTDNMKSVMDEPRTNYTVGKVNNVFKQFADDYGFKVKPCIAGRPNTKAKVEAPMKILDEIKAYSGDLTYSELHQKLEEINDRENHIYHQGYDCIPVIQLQKEKDFLIKLPKSSIRKSYVINTTEVKVNNSSMITYKGNQYSVPPKYFDSKLKLQVYDNQIHLYSNTKLVAVHYVSASRLNYLEDHYIEITKRTLGFKSDTKIDEIAKNNLEMIGEKFKT